MATVKVNGEMNAVVHKGQQWMSIATVPDVCKTPTPGGPVPMPYPNISQASTLSGGTTTVKVDGGNMAAIKGSKFSMSSGDEPGTVGGVKSNTFKRASTWLSYSFDVKFDGQNVCRFTDKKFQNNENTVDAAGVIPFVAQIAFEDVEMKCGELGQYGEQKKNKSAKGKRDRDHIPSKKALLAKAKKLKGSRLKSCQKKLIVNNALSVVIPKKAHRKISPTYGGRGKKLKDHETGLQNAAKRDCAAMAKYMEEKDKNCEAAYKKSCAEIEKITDKDYDKWLDDILKSC
jgi:hypothetical protein